MRSLPLTIVTALLAAGCGSTSTPGNTAPAAETIRIQPSSRIFRSLADAPPAYKSSQKMRAPFKPGYNARGETAPLRSINDVVRNIVADWDALKAVIEAHPKDAPEPFPYEAIGKVADRLVMRARELKIARKLEFTASGKTADEFTPGPIDEKIAMFERNAQRLMLAAYQHMPDELEEVIVSMPKATPEFFKNPDAR